MRISFTTAFAAAAARRDRVDLAQSQRVGLIQSSRHGAKRRSVTRHQMIRDVPYDVRIYLFSTVAVCPSIEVF